MFTHILNDHWFAVSHLDCFYVLHGVCQIALFHLFHCYLAKSIGQVKNEFLNFFSHHIHIAMFFWRLYHFQVVETEFLYNHK